VILIQGLSLAAVHEQAASVTTLTLPVPPALVKDALVGLTAKVQMPACCTM
jgi:hypothetical protein